jgi:transcriptional regulator with XRE-family HTH domain
MYAVMDGSRVEEMRQDRGLSRQRLAQEAGISMSTLRSAERGEWVRAKTARRVARVFGLHPKEIGRPATSWERREMKELDDIIEQLEFINNNLERLVVLKEHELGVKLKEGAGGSGPYVPRDLEE